jgi:hypothetical protein
MGVSEHVRGDILGPQCHEHDGDYTHASTEEWNGRWSWLPAIKRKKVLTVKKISAKQGTAANLQSAASL